MASESEVKAAYFDIVLAYVEVLLVVAEALVEVVHPDPKGDQAEALNTILGTVKRGVGSIVGDLLEAEAAA